MGCWCICNRSRAMDINSLRPRDAYMRQHIVYVTHCAAQREMNPKNNPLVSAQIVHHLSTYIILYVCCEFKICPDSKVHGANMGPTWVLSAPDGPHVGPMNLAIRVFIIWNNAGMLSIGPPGTIFSDISIKNHTFWFKKLHLKISYAKWLSFCLGLNALQRPSSRYKLSCLNLAIDNCPVLSDISGHVTRVQLNERRLNIYDGVFRWLRIVHSTDLRFN